jgi:hypothetical protein
MRLGIKKYKAYFGKVWSGLKFGRQAAARVLPKDQDKLRNDESSFGPYSERTNIVRLKRGA